MDTEAPWPVYRDALGAFARDRALALTPLAAPYRRSAPFAHPRAGEDSPDLELIAGLYHLGGVTLLRARHLHVVGGVPRSLPMAGETTDEQTATLSVPASPNALADALALGLALHVEGDKLSALGAAATTPEVLASALGRTTLDLATLFGDPETAVAAVRALSAGGPLHLSLAGGASSPNRTGAIDTLLVDAALEAETPIYIFAGATEVLHDLISPYARRLGPRLDQLTGAGDDDARYDAIALLMSEAPEAHDERAALEARDGLTPAGAATVVRTHALHLEHADPRVRSALRALASKRAGLVVTGRDPAALAQVLAHLHERVRGVTLFVEGAPAPERGFAQVPAVTDEGRPVLAPGRAPKEAPVDSGRVDVPSVGLCPGTVRGVTGFVALSEVVAHHIAAGTLPADLRCATLLTAPGQTKAAAEAAAFILTKLASAS